MLVVCEMEDGLQSQTAGMASPPTRNEKPRQPQRVDGEGRGGCNLLGGSDDAFATELGERDQQRDGQLARRKPVQNKIQSKTCMQGKHCALGTSEPSLHTREGPDTISDISYESVICDLYDVAQYEQT